MRRYNVVYTVPVGYSGTIVCTKLVRVRNKETFFEACARHNIGDCSVVAVYPGSVKAIDSDWSKL